MSAIDTKTIRELAQGATRGPWSYRFGDVVQLSDAGKGYPIGYYPGCADIVSVDQDGDRVLSDANGEYIAAASPDVVIGLLDQLAAVTAARDELADIADNLNGESSDCRYDPMDGERITHLRSIGVAK
jgi:ABC-type Fe3+-hydroxamate transport system substrate-binding protein